MKSPLEGTTLTASFGADGSINGSSGCNSFSGTYSVDGSSLSIGPLSSSQMLCEDDVMAQEAAYQAALESAAGYSIEMGLIITNGSGQAVVEYVAR
jgi:heat shock protein HslJ